MSPATAGGGRVRRTRLLPRAAEEAEATTGRAKDPRRRTARRRSSGSGSPCSARLPAGARAEVKQEDPDYGDEELEELGGLARQVAVKASEAYARGTLASVRSRLRTWDAAVRRLEKAGVVKRDPRPGFLTPVVLRKTVAYLCLRKYKSARGCAKFATRKKRRSSEGPGLSKGAARAPRVRGGM